MVAGKNGNIFGIIAINKIDVLINCVCGTFIPLSTLNLLIRRKNMNSAVSTVKIPCRTVSDVIVELKRLILSENADRFNSGIDAV